jgi:hypothetical protein
LESILSKMSRYEVDLSDSVVSFISSSSGYIYITNLFCLYELTNFYTWHNPFIGLWSDYELGWKTKLIVTSRFLLWRYACDVILTYNVKALKPFRFETHFYFYNIFTRPCLKIEKNINITIERHFVSVHDHEPIWIWAKFSVNR